MPIEFRCDQCGKLLRTGDETAGRQAKCPECGALMTVPDAGGAATISPEPVDAPSPGGSGSPFGSTSGENPYESPSQPSSPYGAAPPPGSVPNYLVHAILVTLFCCVPFGIVSIVFAAQVNGKLAVGDYHGAVEASNHARTWCLVAFGLGLFIRGLWAMVVCSGVVAG